MVTVTVTGKFYNYNHETNWDLKTLSVSQFKKSKVKTSQAPQEVVKPLFNQGNPFRILKSISAINRSPN